MAQGDLAAPARGSGPETQAGVNMVVTPLVGLLAFGGYYTVSPIFERTTLIEASPLEALLASSAGSGVATDGEIKSEAEEAAQDDGNVTLL